jgi:EAL domain-containing protein (putative c-di-GMP-specific phosphodiesterase class I)
VQFQNDDLVPLVSAILTETGLAANRLVLEVTEGVLIADYARAMTILNGLCALGAEIALDDFGSGYSSLSYLQEFPFSEIKIDRNFTAKLGICARSKPIVRSVIELGHALGLRVVAEGVETEDQIAFLSTTQCDLVQGYLTGRPAAIETYAGVTLAA